ncbi:hypothetical protein SEUCBS139899_010659, partial [Sporothrix eucalyptigena]
TFLDGQPSSTFLVYVSGILGFSHDAQSFQSATLYTPLLSALIYTQRILFLEWALPLRAYPSLGIPARPFTGLLDRLQRIQRAYLVEGSQSAFDELFSLRAAGRAAARNEPPSTFFRWSDDGQTLSYEDGVLISMDQFRLLSQYALTTSEQLACRVLCGFRPAVNLSSLRDEMTNTDMGFSFVSHPSNGLSTAYQALLQAAATSRYYQLIRAERWNQAGITRYLNDVQALERMLLLGLYTACGQAPRAEDLLSVRWQNGAGCARGIYVWNGSLIYVVRHHKAKRRSNHEFYSVRFLPSRLAFLLLSYLVYIRPFCQLLRRETSPGLTQEAMTNRAYLFLFQPYKASRAAVLVTSILRDATSKIWNRALGIQAYRQLSIAIAEKHVRELRRPADVYDDRSREADLHVALAWQSGHRPLVRGTHYGLDGAFPARLQPNLLRAYELLV